MITLFSCGNSGIEVSSNWNLFDSEYVDNVVLLSECPDKLLVLHLPSVKCFYSNGLAQSRTLLFTEVTG